MQFAACESCHLIMGLPAEHTFVCGSTWIYGTKLMTKVHTSTMALGTTARSSRNEVASGSRNDT